MATTRSTADAADPDRGGDAVDAAGSASHRDEQAPSRVPSVDIVRGLVMIVMALDHVRDFTHRGAMVASPTDLATTTPFLFMTRWVTHLCAPTFALTAGIAAWLWWRRGRTRAQLSRFLAGRGLWLIALELVVMRVAYNFSWSPDAPVFLLVLWSLGLSMIVLAALVWLPTGALVLLSVAAILLHPLLDAITAEHFGAATGLWHIVHQVGAFRVGGADVITPYPLIPWLGVMALGFTLGPLFAEPASRRRRALVALGCMALAGFAVMRLINDYGDPVPWRVQDTPLFTVLSFLNTSKYPASPDFLLMTLGMAFLLLALFDRARPEQGGPLAVATLFGRVPLFYFVFHFFAAHLIATAMAIGVYGRAALDFIFLPYPSMGGPAGRFPAGFGHGLGATYLVWLAVVGAGYFACRWYGDIKSRRRDWWLAYL